MDWRGLDRQSSNGAYRESDHSEWVVLGRLGLLGDDCYFVSGSSRWDFGLSQVNRGLWIGGEERIPPLQEFSVRIFMGRN